MTFIWFPCPRSVGVVADITPLPPGPGPAEEEARRSEDSEVHRPAAGRGRRARREGHQARDHEGGTRWKYFCSERKYFLAQHRGRLKNSMLADEADNPGFLLLLEQAEREMRNSRPEVAATYLTKWGTFTVDTVMISFMCQGGPDPPRQRGSEDAARKGSADVRPVRGGAGGGNRAPSPNI